MKNEFDNLAYLLGKPEVSGKIKVKPEDFVVVENFADKFSQDGEHVMLFVEKKEENTRYVVNELAKYCGVSSKQASWSGLKDKHALTRQWISIQMPGKDAPDFADFEATHPGVKILDKQRHNKKLRQGDHDSNYFKIIIRDLGIDKDLIAKLDAIKEQGYVLNYFGEQRFGIEFNNIEQARLWGARKIKVKDRAKRSFYLSAARSWLFNLITDYRVKNHGVNKILLGDILLSKDNGTETLVTAETIEVLQQEVDLGNYNISAALVGDNALPCKLEALALEELVMSKEADLVQLIRDNRMQHARRALILHCEQFNYKLMADDILELEFTLPSGCFATAVLRELVML